MSPAERIAVARARLEDAREIAEERREKAGRTAKVLDAFADLADLAAEQQAEIERIRNALEACRIIDAAVREGHDSAGALIEHLLGAVEPARAALGPHRIDGTAVDPFCDYCGERHEGACEEDV